MTTGSINRQIRVTAGETVIDYGVIDIDISKTADDNPPETKVAFHNLSRSTEARFLPEQFVRVEAGQDRLQQVFEGQILRIEKKIAKPDTSLTLFLSTHVLEKPRQINRSFSTASLRVVVQELIAEMGLAPGDLSAIPPGLIIDQFAFQGFASNGLRELLHPHGYTWYIENGLVNVTSPGQRNSIFSVYRLNSETGMVGSPELTDTGARVKVLLDTPITLNQLVEVESSNYVYGYQDNEPYRDTRDIQEYKVFGMHYRGNNWGGNLTNTLRLETLIT